MPEQVMIVKAQRRGLSAVMGDLLAVSVPVRAHTTREGVFVPEHNATVHKRDGDAAERKTLEASVSYTARANPSGSDADREIMDRRLAQSRGSHSILDLPFGHEIRTHKQGVDHALSSLRSASDVQGRYAYPIYESEAAQFQRIGAPAFRAGDGWWIDAAYLLTRIRSPAATFRLHPDIANTLRLIDKRTPDVWEFDHSAYPDVASEYPVVAKSAAYLFLKAAHIAHNPGLVLTPVTDRLGRRSARWRRIHVPKGRGRDTVTEDMLDPRMSGDLYDPSVARRRRVRPPILFLKPAPEAPEQLDLFGGADERADHSPDVSVDVGQDDGPYRRPDSTAEQPYLADGIKLSRAELTQRPTANQLPGDLAGSLRPHAQDSVNLALEQYAKGARSFLIADGTGAGKTRQALALAEIQRRAAPDKPILIVTQNARVVADAFENDAAAMGVAITPVDTLSEIKGGGIYVATYTRVGRGDFDGGAFETVILDEAHNLKNYTSKKTKAVSDLLKAAKRSLLLTATPGDKPNHIGYLASAFGFSYLKAMAALGYVKGKYGLELQHGVTLDQALQRLGSLFDDLTRKGLMVKREVSMDNIRVSTAKVQIDPEGQETLAKANEAMLREVARAPAQERGLTKMLGLNHLRNALEPYKIDATVQAVRDNRAAGKQVVVFANRIESSDLPDWWPDGETSDGTLDTLADRIEAEGLRVGRVYGKHLRKTKGAIDDFQAGDSDVVIATPQGGGTGINLDDTVGDKPRAMVIMTAPFSSLEAVQMIGRINRLTTKSRADVQFIQAAGIPVDEWNFGIIEAKLANLGAAVQGDVSKLDLRRVEHLADEDLETIGLKNIPVSAGPEIDLASLGLRTGGQPAASGAAKAAKTYLRVPYDDKDYAKRYGARWDPDRRQWYVTGDVPSQLAKYSGGHEEPKKAAPDLSSVVRPETMTADQIAATHEALRCISGACDGARSHDDMGFNRMDAGTGYALASALELTPAQAARGRALVYKYKGQLHPHLVERMGKPAAGGSEIDEAKAEAAHVPTATYKGKRYAIGWSGKTKFGHRTKLVMSDGREFWVDTSALNKALIVFIKRATMPLVG